MTLDRVQAALAERQPSRMVPDLARITELVDLLGSPQRAYPSIHLTGTNGKTSTARMIDALLRSVGLRTGRYTSPHLESVTERICIDGEPLSADLFAQTYDEVAPYVELVDVRHPERVTYFELLTAMAFAAFADAPVEVAVVEVGMGGSWDATNVIQAPVAVLTPIAVDHRELGATPGAIAVEKAGIVYEGTSVITAVQPPDAAEAILRRTVEVGAQVAREGIEFGIEARSLAVGGQSLGIRGLHRSYGDVFLPLHGSHQARNASYAVAAVEAFLSRELDPDAVREAFASVTSPGRLETMRTSPTILLDAAHNPAGAETLATALEEAFTFTRLVGVVAVLGDKDVHAMLTALEPVLTEVVVTQSSSPRALPVDDLAAIAEEVFGSDRVSVEDRIDDAIDTAVRLTEEGGAYGGAGVLITGSVVTVGEARALLRR